MLGRIIRIVLGFVAACLGAGLTLVLFVNSPVELATTPRDDVSSVLLANALFTLAAATHSAVFAAPFALVAAAIGEWRGVGSWIYYALAGIAIAGLGFLAHFLSEGGVGTSVVNNYALSAFLTTGFVSGMIYWVVSGQFARADANASAPDIIAPSKPSPEAVKPSASRPA